MFPDQETLCPKREVSDFQVFASFSPTLSSYKILTRQFRKKLNGEVLDITFFYMKLFEFYS